MTVTESFSRELESEAITTRKMLERVPFDNYNWKPHEKSMTLQKLASHVAELPSWISMTLNTNELDFAQNPYTLPEITSSEQLMKYFEKNLAEGRSELAKATEEQLSQPWILRNGEDIYNVSPKGDVLRMTYCQIVHHRAQLGVYLRLLNIPIPGSYGPSADEMTH